MILYEALSKNGASAVRLFIKLNKLIFHGQLSGIIEKWRLLGTKETQNQSAGSFKGWISMSEQLQTSLTSSTTMSRVRVVESTWPLDSAP